MDSILTSIKRLLGIEEDYEHFDMELIMHINSVFTILLQLGLGPITGFKIMDKTNLWEEFLEDKLDLELIRTYMYHKVRLMFDPPNNSFLVENIKTQINEFEWRLNVQAEGLVVEEVTE